MYSWSDAMGVAGPIHWLLFLVLVALVLYPIGRILTKIGFSPFWSILVFVPILNLLALWILACSDWPEQKSAPSG
ncbi:MAG: hypothetical protein EKK40_09590 [Bradyrhizobiaceae bacterium]|nr:MAG: hypothetical protein EKK40_09590 [Bradyrhizobiaceae bacterium]